MAEQQAAPPVTPIWAWSLSAILALASLGVLLSRVPAMRCASDTPWHILAGDMIRATNLIPATNTFSFSAPDYPWMNLSWAYDIFLSFIHSIAGLEGAIGMTLALLVAIPVTLAIYLARRETHLIAIFIGVLLSVMVMAMGAMIRPQSATYLCALFAYLALRESHRQRAWLVMLPMLMLLWVNLHGGFLFMLVLIGVFGLEALWQKNRPRILALSITGLACLAMVPLTPLGLDIVEGVWQTLGNVLVNHILEWRSLDPAEAMLPALYLLVLLGVMGWSRHEQRLADVILAITLVAMGVDSVRHLPLMGILTAIPLTVGLSVLIERSQWWKAKSEDYASDMSHPAVAIVLWGVIGVGVIAGCSVAVMHANGKKPLDFASECMPVEALTYFQERYPGFELLNHYNYGGYVAWKSNQSIRVFIDGRAGTAYPDSVIEDYLAFTDKRDGWEAMLERYGIDAALMPKKDPVKQYFEDNEAWARIFDDDAAILYLKALPEEL